MLLLWFRSVQLCLQHSPCFSVIKVFCHRQKGKMLSFNSLCDVNNVGRFINFPLQLIQAWGWRVEREEGGGTSWQAGALINKTGRCVGMTRAANGTMCIREKKGRKYRNENAVAASAVSQALLQGQRKAAIRKAWRSRFQMGITAHLGFGEGLGNLPSCPLLAWGHIPDRESCLSYCHLMAHDRRGYVAGHIWLQS